MLTTVSASAPSNIALIKYWGKSDPALNWPANDSLSMTLSRAATTTTARIRTGAATPQHHQLAFAGFEARTPNAKTIRFLEWLRGEVARFGQAEGALDLVTANTFPSSCGIASSASGFAALTVAAAGAWLGADSMEALAKKGVTEDLLATWARRGSGSACRSISGGFVLWERGDDAAHQKTRSVFSSTWWELADLIVIIDDSAKSVSSSDGHARAFSSPLMQPRLQKLPERIQKVAAAIETRDLPKLGALIEEEAIEMHEIMRTSSPRTEYFGAPTIEFLDWLRQGRAAGDLPAWFTLDAGPNPHLICLPEDSQRIKTQIQARFPGMQVIQDITGKGATLGRQHGH
ncbi:MAG: diphosphomevalonate decarboxylase [Pseudomonadota bacterium]|jgi:diphosphomevalonate decarboxylase